MAYANIATGCTALEDLPFTTKAELRARHEEYVAATPPAGNALVDEDYRH